MLRYYFMPGGRSISGREFLARGIPLKLSGFFLFQRRPVIGSHRNETAGRRAPTNVLCIVCSLVRQFVTGLWPLDFIKLRYEGL